MLMPLASIQGTVASLVARHRDMDACKLQHGGHDDRGNRAPDPRVNKVGN
jgi:hypothetical protein